MSFDGDLGLHGFIKLDPELIRKALSLFDQDPVVQTVFNITMNSLLNGNIVFEHPKGNKSSRFSEDPEAVRWRSQTYGRLSRQKVRHLYALGWTPVVIRPDPVHVGRPTVLELERCDTYYRLDVYGECTFRYFERLDFPYTATQNLTRDLFLNTHATGMFIEGNRREIQGVKTFVIDPPTMHGELRSRITLLAPDLLFESFLFSCCWEAERHRANPPIISQKETNKPDSKALTITDAMDFASKIHSVYNGDGKQEGPIREGQLRQYEERTRQAEQVASLMDASAQANDLDPRHMLKKRKLVHGTPVSELYMETDRQYVKHTLPESPQDMLLAFRNARIERVMSVFSVPMSMVSQSSSLSSKSSMNENAYLIFMDAQKHLKQMLISFLYEIYRAVYDDTNAADYIIDAIRRRADDDPDADPEESYAEAQETIESGLDSALHVEISMPGLPPESIVERLFLLGLMTYDAYCEFIHAKHAIPLANFNPKPQLTLEQMNQLPPLEDETGRSGATKRAKN